MQNFNIIADLCRSAEGFVSILGGNLKGRFFHVKVRKLLKVRNRYNQVPHLTKGTTLESDKNTIKHHKRESRGQPFPSNYKAAINRRKSMKTLDINNTNDPQKKYCLKALYLILHLKVFRTR